MDLDKIERIVVRVWIYGILIALAVYVIGHREGPKEKVKIIRSVSV